MSTEHGVDPNETAYTGVNIFLKMDKVEANFDFGLSLDVLRKQILVNHYSTAAATILLWSFYVYSKKVFLFFGLNIDSIVAAVKSKHVRRLQAQNKKYSSFGLSIGYLGKHYKFLTLETFLARLSLNPF